MTEERARAKAPLTPKDDLERIYQLAIAGQAAMNSNLEREHLDAAASEIFKVITEIAAFAAELLEELEQREVVLQA